MGNILTLQVDSKENFELGPHLHRYFNHSLNSCKPYTLHLKLFIVTPHLPPPQTW
jgi:hypothetical protein